MAKKVEKKKDNKDKEKATSKTSNTTKKSGISMKKTEMKKDKKQSEKEKDKKKKTQTTQASSSKSSNKKSKSDKNLKTTAEKDSSKKKNKKVKPTNKPKTKKDYEEDDELLDEEELDDEEYNEDESEEEIEDEEVTEVEEIDLSSIEPVIDPVLDDDDEDDEDVPKTRGRKKQAQPEQQHQLTMEEIIRNRPLQIDPTQKVYVTKKEDEPKPYIAPEKTTKERYSDEELQEFKEIILQKLHETRENYEQLKKYFTHEDDHGTDDTSPTFKMIEDGSEVMTKEEIEQQLARLEKYMIDLQNALLRIENKTYGICTVTGKLIPKERLRSVPHATKSIEAKINRD
jgi:DnaK suppressor protein